MNNIKRLNLGCGKDYKAGFVNLDYNSQYKLDISHNLDKFPYPFKAESFDYIYCSHILEHVEDLFKTIEEIERILKKRGALHIRVPHFSNGNGYNDLSHKRFFGWFTFKRISEGYYNKKLSFKIVRQRFNFLADNHPIANGLFSWFFNLMPKQFYERFLCWIFPVGEIEIKLQKI
ncbi:MAG: methyltransferase domain-containing protein [archaeon]|nr:methyltransferase domain-containing protein [archaeon]